MKVKVEALDQHKVSLHIEVEAEAVVKGFKQAVSRISNRVNVPGFRKGKHRARLWKCVSEKQLLLPKHRIS